MLTLPFIFLFQMSRILDQKRTSGTHDDWAHLGEPGISDLLKQVSSRTEGVDNH